MNTKKIRVVIADDHQIILDGLMALLATTEDIEVVGLACNGKEILEIPDLNQPDVDVVVTDVDMPVMDGLDATRKIKAKYPGIKVIIVTMHNKKTFQKEIIKSGSDGYLLKNRSSNELVKAIRFVNQGGEYFSGISDEFVEEVRNEQGQKEAVKIKFTSREKEVLQLTGEGLSVKQISDSLKIATSSVETHQRNLMDKSGLKSDQELREYARENRDNDLAT